MKLCISDVLSRLSKLETKFGKLERSLTIRNREVDELKDNVAKYRLVGNLKITAEGHNHIKTVS